jgi:hypothetical protein
MSVFPRKKHHCFAKSPARELSLRRAAVVPLLRVKVPQAVQTKPKHQIDRQGIHCTALNLFAILKDRKDTEKLESEGKWAGRK